jgi:hypothetical protein
MGSSSLASLVTDIDRLSGGQAEFLLSQLRAGLQNETSEDGHYRAAEALSTVVYPKYKFSEFARIFLEDEAFIRYYERFMDPGNWHSLDRKYTLNQLLKLTLHLAGDLAECGTYKGASAYLMCEAHRNDGRLIHLFDSFEGLSAPARYDGNYWEQGRFGTPEELVHQNLADFQNFRVYKGWIPKRFEEVAGTTFSFVHVDVDLYQPTLDSLEFFYGRMAPGGIILMDDYGFKNCPGAKRAADEFFSTRREPIVMLTTGQAFTLKQ